MKAQPDLRILSLGLGTQSCALALMDAQGEFSADGKPTLDGIVFADTQGELPETYAYLDYLRGVVEPAGIPLHVVTAGSLEAALLVDHAIDKNPTPPAHVLNPPDALHPDGSKGRITDYRCSYDYKRREITKAVKKLCGGRGAWKRSTVEQWIGFSLDEMQRMKQFDGCRCGHNRTVRKKVDGRVKIVLIHTAADGCTRCECGSFHPWQINRWPLIEMRMRREDTIRWFARNGHPTPPRSACWFCPNSGQDRWQYLKANHPDLWERACALDETIRDGGGFNQRGKQPFRGQLFLHGSLAALRDADLRTKAEVLSEDHGQDAFWSEDQLAGDCAGEVCFT